MNLNIVLYEPEIPQNTGNIGRTCVLTNSTLHLIRPLGFEVSDKHLKRAGMDYWKQLNIFYYDNFDAFYKINGSNRIYLSTTKAKNIYSDVKYSKGDFIMFGKESAGVPEYLRDLLKETSIKIPMVETSERSLNLSNSAAVIMYEALRQINFIGMR